VKILLAIDDSPCSEAAVRGVIERIRPENVEVVVLTVVDLINYFTSEKVAKAYLPQIDELRHEKLKAAEELVLRAVGQLRAAGFTADSGISEGDPRHRIIAFAEEWGADLIMLGSHGRRGFDRALLGSVSEAVVRYARCSVAVVRTPPGG
jgi:nucleotide-binding universal stress UspA family protein